MLKFSIKNAFRKKGIAILSSVGVGFGLMLVFVIGAFSAGVTAQFEDNLTRTIGVVEVIEKDELGANSHLPINLTNKLLETPETGEFITKYNVETQVPVAFTSDYTGKMKNAGDTLTLLGLNTTLDETWEGPTSKILNGRSFDIGKNESIIDSRLADVAQFSVNIGSIIEIDIGIKNVSLTIVGIYEQEDLGAPDFVPRDYYIYTDIETVWDLLDEAGEVTDLYTKIYLRFDVNTVNETTAFADKINDYSNQGRYLPTRVSAFSSAAFFESFEDTFGILNAFTSIIGFITVLAGGMAIIVTQLMSVSSRMKEFAILKATGWKNSHIFKNVVYESLALGALGAIIGLGLGSILILALGSGASPFGAASTIITIEGILEVLAYALGLGILGGLYPGIKAARVRPVKVLKGD